MNKTELLEELHSLNIVKKSRQGSTRPIYIDDAALCGNIPLVRRISRLLAIEIAKAYPASKDIRGPNIIATKGFKESLFSQWFLAGLEEHGFTDMRFKWYDKNHSPGKTETEPYCHKITPEDNVFLCSIDLAERFRYESFLRHLWRENARIGGAITVFNSEDLHPRDLNIPSIFSLYNRRDIESVLRDAPQTVLA